VSVAKIDAENAVIYAKSWGKCSELTAFIAATHAVTTGIATMLVAHAARAGWRCCKTGFCAPNCDGAATEPLLLRFFMVGSRLKIRVSLVRFRLWPPFFIVRMRPQQAPRRSKVMTSLPCAAASQRSTSLILLTLVWITSN